MRVALVLHAAAAVAAGYLTQTSDVSACSSAPFVYITSTGSKAVQKRIIHQNVFDRPLITPLWVFAENSWERVHFRRPLRISNMPAATCMSDIFEVTPWLMEELGPNGALDRFYDFAGTMEPCDQPLRIKSGKILLRKLLSVKHALDKMADGSVVIWLDTDVTVLNDISHHEPFKKFVTEHDISYIPFTTNKGWGEPVYPNFLDIESPYWRIESGIMAVKASERTRALFAEAAELYRGKLLEIAKRCIEFNDLPICSQTWFQRNTYMDDIFAFSLLLHKYKYDTTLKQAWFSMGCGKHCHDYVACNAAQLPLKGLRYFFSHVCTSQTNYTSSFNLQDIFLHHIGTGAYSSTFRSAEGGAAQKVRIDKELQFTGAQKFNDTVELRYKGANLQKLEDWIWDLDTMRARQMGGMWPMNAPLQHPNPPRTRGDKFSAEWRRGCTQWNCPRLDPRRLSDSANRTA